MDMGSLPSSHHNLIIGIIMGTELAAVVLLYVYSLYNPTYIMQNVESTSKSPILALVCKAAFTIIPPNPSQHASAQNTTPSRIP